MLHRVENRAHTVDSDWCQKSRTNFTLFDGLYEFANNGNCKYWNVAVNQLSRNLQVSEFEDNV